MAQVATRLDGTGIRRAHGDEILLLCTHTPSWFPEAALVLIALFILLLPPFLVHIYICQSWFYQFSDRAAHPAPLVWNTVLCSPYLMTF